MTQRAAPRTQRGRVADQRGGSHKRRWTTPRRAPSAKPVAARCTTSAVPPRLNSGKGTPANGSTPRFPPTDTTASTPNRMARPPASRPAGRLYAIRAANASRHTKTAAATRAAAPASRPHCSTRLASARSLVRSGRYWASSWWVEARAWPSRPPDANAMCDCSVEYAEPAPLPAPDAKPCKRATW